MKKMLNQTDITNLLALIAAAPIKGAEAITVGQLQQKLNTMLTDLNNPKPDGTSTKSK